ncbi:MAG: hypothetical protein IJ106_05280 [Parasporobacterium sp.]|nr:hypothetical protein [Parasporobacterium sp.]
MDFENSKIEQARTEHEILLEDPKTAKKRRRADKRRRRKYKFSDKHHSVTGIVFTILTVPALACIVLALVLATMQKGQGSRIVGWLPFAALLISSAGIIGTALSFRRTDTIYTFSWTGLISHIVIWLFVAFILVIGL